MNLVESNLRKIVVKHNTFIISQTVTRPIKRFICNAVFKDFDVFLLLIVTTYDSIPNDSKKNRVAISKIG